MEESSIIAEEHQPVVFYPPEVQEQPVFVGEEEEEEVSIDINTSLLVMEQQLQVSQQNP